MEEAGNVSDDTSYDTMFIVGQTSRKSANTSYWIADNAGLGVDYRIVTSTGDHLVWSS